MLKIAHRGSVNGKVKDYRGNSTYHKFPDNSMLSYINAIYEKFDMIECDVSLTSDNVLIMFHDSHVGSIPVHKISYQEMKNKFKYLITFDYFCKNIYPQIPILLDIKGQNDTAIHIVEYFKKTKIDLSNFYISSFNRNHLVTIYNFNKNIPLGVIYDGVMLDIEKTFLIGFLKLAFVSIDWRDLNEKEINFYKKHNISVFSWTNKNHITRRAYPDNIDGIITDYMF